MDAIVSRSVEKLVEHVTRNGPMTMAIVLELVASEPGESHRSAACAFWQAHREGLVALDHRGMVVLGGLYQR
jgi:hypothetical protein